MKRLLVVLVTLSCGLASSARAEDPDQARYRFLVGSYACVGRMPDSTKTYTGQVQIREAKGGIRVVRTIAGKKVEATGQFGTVTPDKISVLNLRFRQDHLDYEATCLVSTDLDNYPRITCHVATGKSKKVGLETLFADYGQLGTP
ncbi:MAG: hypothetical protein HY902_00190 [Deltaproteobacteria bacterium]|nr:hypothetical protein [Deltaproteobacteria bacterium]